MRKNYFLFLCSILMGVMLLGTACTSDEGFKNGCCRRGD